MSLVRVFPRRTQATPDDDLAFIGPPPLFLPQIQEIHISVAFTWRWRGDILHPCLSAVPALVWWGKTLRPAFICDYFTGLSQPLLVLRCLAAAEKRLRAVGMPFAMLYRDAQIGVGVSFSG